MSPAKERTATSEIEALTKDEYVPDIQIFPDNYIVDKKTRVISKLQYKGQGDKQVITAIPIARTIVLPTARLVNGDTGMTSYELGFNKRTVILSGADLSNKKGIQILENAGALVNESQTKDISEFWQEYISLNKLPKKQIFESQGWKQDGFLLGNTLITEDINKICELLNQDIVVKGITTKGNIKGWIDAVSPLMQYDTQRFKIYIATTAFLLKILNAQSFSLVDYGNTSIGKTITSAVCASMFGNPQELILGGNTTKVGIEVLAGICTDIPLFLDDLQNMRKDAREFTVYQLANGTGKVRGAKEGGLRDVQHWRTIGMFTAETPILEENTHAGAGMRLLEVTGGLGVLDDHAVNHFKAKIEDNHGTFAPILIKYIIENKKQIKTIHKKHFEKLQKQKQKYSSNEQKSGIAGRLAGIFASILTAGTIFERVYSDAGGKRKEPEQVILPVFEKQLSVKSTESYAIRGLNHIRGWVASNRDNFLTLGARDDERKSKVYGNIESDYIDIIPGELNKELESIGFSTARLIDDYKEAGLLITDKDRKSRKTKTAKLNGLSSKVYRFKRKEFERTDMDGILLNTLEGDTEYGY